MNDFRGHWFLIFVGVLSITLYAICNRQPEPNIVPRLQCIRCHWQPAIRTVGQYRRVHSGKPRTADDMRAIRELKEQEYIMSQILATTPQH